MESVKKAIEALCETANHQEELLVEIYKLYIDDFDRINKIQGFPWEVSLKNCSFEYK